MPVLDKAPPWVLYEDFGRTRLRKTVDLSGWAIDEEDLAIIASLAAIKEKPADGVVRAPSLTGGKPSEVEPLITGLVLRNCRTLTNRMLTDFLSTMYRIKFLDLRGCPITNSGINRIAQDCLYLEGVMLPVTDRITDVSIRQLITRCTRLHTLHLGGSPSITDDLVEVMAERGRFPTYALWKELHFVDCPSIGDSLMSRLLSSKGCTRLEKLTLQACPKLTDMCLIGIANSGTDVPPPRPGFVTKEAPTGNAHLRVLDLSDFEALTDRGLAFAVQGCENIEEVILDRCVKLTDQGIRFLAHSCVGLKKFSIVDIDCITDRGILALVTAGAGLSAAQRHSDLNDDELLGLDTLELTGVAAGDRSSLMFKGGHRLPPPPPPCMLEDVTLDGAFHIGDLGVGYIAARCRRLRTLSLRGCFDVSGTGLLELWQRCPVLRVVSCEAKFILPTVEHTKEFADGGAAKLRDDKGIGAKLPRKKRRPGASAVDWGSEGDSDSDDEGATIGAAGAGAGGAGLAGVVTGRTSSRLLTNRRFTSPLQSARTGGSATSRTLQRVSRGPGHAVRRRLPTHGEVDEEDEKGDDEESSNSDESCDFSVSSGSEGVDDVGLEGLPGKRVGGGRRHSRSSRAQSIASGVLSTSRSRHSTSGPPYALSAVTASGRGAGRSGDHGGSVSHARAGDPSAFPLPGNSVIKDTAGGPGRKVRPSVPGTARTSTRMSARGSQVGTLEDVDEGDPKPKKFVRKKLERPVTPETQEQWEKRQIEEIDDALRLTFSQTRSDHYHSNKAVTGSFNDGPRINDDMLEQATLADEIFAPLKDVLPSGIAALVSRKGPRTPARIGPEHFSLVTLRSDKIDATAYLKIYDACPDVYFLPSPSDAIVSLMLFEGRRVRTLWHRTLMQNRRNIRAQVKLYDKRVSEKREAAAKSRQIAEERFALQALEELPAASEAVDGDQADSDGDGGGDGGPGKVALEPRGSPRPSSFAGLGTVTKGASSSAGTILSTSRPGGMQAEAAPSTPVGAAGASNGNLLASPAGRPSPASKHKGLSSSRKFSRHLGLLSDTPDSKVSGVSDADQSAHLLDDDDALDAELDALIGQPPNHSRQDGMGEDDTYEYLYTPPVPSLPTTTFAHLKTLILRKCDTLVDEAMDCVGFCPRLTSLDLTNCMRLTDAGIARLKRALDRTVSLRLFLRKRVLTRAHAWRREVFRQRVVLAEGRWSDFRDRLTRDLPSWTVHGWGTKTKLRESATLDTFAEAHRMHRLESLREMRSNYQVNEVDVVGPLRVRRQPPQKYPEYDLGFQTARERETHPLKHLVLRYIPKLSDASLVPLMSSTPHLRSLDITGTGATDAVLREIGVHCEYFQRLNAKGCLFGLPGGYHLTSEYLSNKVTAGDMVHSPEGQGVTEKGIAQLAAKLRFGVNTSSNRRPLTISPAPQCQIIIQAEEERTKKREAVVVIQRAVRLWLAFEATLNNTFPAEVLVAKRWEDTCIIQRAFRMYREYRDYSKVRRVVLFAQRFFRGRKARDLLVTLMELKAQRFAAANVINPGLQALHRGRKTRREFAAWHRSATAAALSLQRMFRGHTGRKMWAVRLQLMQHSARRIQFTWHSHCIWMAYRAWGAKRLADIREEDEAVQRIQWAVRMFLSRCRIGHRRRLIFNASTSLQRIGRGWFERRKNLAFKLRVHNGAKKIQRGYRAWKLYLYTQAMHKQAVEVLERAWISYKGSIFRAVMRLAAKRRFGATEMQRLYRGHRGRREVFILRRINRGIFLDKSRMVAANLRRKMFIRHGAARVIQIKWRVNLMWIALQQGVVGIKDRLARRIQWAWVGFKGRKYAREYRAQLTHVALQVQRVFRGIQARKRAAGLRYNRDMDRAARKIQAAIRGRIARKVVMILKGRQQWVARQVQRIWRRYRRRVHHRRNRILRNRQAWELMVADGYERKPKKKLFKKLPEEAASQAKVMESVYGRMQQDALLVKRLERDAVARTIRSTEGKIRRLLVQSRKDYARSAHAFPAWARKRREVEYYATEAYGLMEDHTSTQAEHDVWKDDVTHVRRTIDDFCKVLDHRVELKAGLLGKDEVDNLFQMLELPDDTLMRLIDVPEGSKNFPSAAERMPASVKKRAEELEREKAKLAPPPPRALDPPMLFSAVPDSSFDPPSDGDE